MYNLINYETDRLNDYVTRGAKTAMNDLEFFAKEITRWKNSPKRQDMLLGERYYEGVHDILKRKREAIGKDGELHEVTNLPNNKITDNQYAKMVDQKANYLLGKPITFSSESKDYTKLLTEIFDNRFRRVLRNMGEDSLNGGIGWLHPYYDDSGVFRLKRFAPSEVLPFWSDSEHTILDAAARVYTVNVYEGSFLTRVEKVEIYTKKGVDRYTLNGGTLVPDRDMPHSGHMSLDGKPFNWDRVPLVAFKFNSKEIPLITRVKSIQDAINKITSNFMNNMEEDARNTILVLVNYDGTNLGEFRHNLAQYGVVKVRTTDGVHGDVRTLTIEVNSENYKAILEILKKALIENARGFDAKDDRLSGTPNQMNIQSMYSDIDLDANNMETEYQASFEELFYFVNAHLANTGGGDFFGEKVNVIFNRDILINESEAITNCQQSTGILSMETIIEQHPWVNDKDEEIKRRESEEAKEQLPGAFNNHLNGGDNDGEE